MKQNMYGSEEVDKTFDEGFLSPELIHAQWAEFTELRRIISRLTLEAGRPIKILDIGMGNARIPVELSKVPAMWDKIGQYDGIDNSEESLDSGIEQIKRSNISDKVRAILLDAKDLSSLEREYDMVTMTWFTAGNLYPENFDFEKYPNGEDGRLDLTEHPKLTSIFSNAYKLINPGGSLVVGSYYVDNGSTRKMQEGFYKKCGWEITTDKDDRFTATKSGWWSQRYTKADWKRYLPFLGEDQLAFTALDPYEYAMMLEIRNKPA